MDIEYIELSNILSLRRESSIMSYNFLRKKVYRLSGTSFLFALATRENNKKITFSRFLRNYLGSIIKDINPEKIIWRHRISHKLYYYLLENVIPKI